MPTSVHTGITPFGDLGRGESRVQTGDLALRRPETGGCTARIPRVHSTNGWAERGSRPLNDTFWGPAGGAHEYGVWLRWEPWDGSTAGTIPETSS